MSPRLKSTAPSGHLHDDIEVSTSRWQKHDPSTANQPEPRPEWCPISICRHVPASEIPHIDLFLAPQTDFDDDARILKTWRLSKNPLELDVGEITKARSLQPHRGVYARLQGPVRPKTMNGMVTPLARGEARIKEDSQPGLILEVRWLDGVAARYLITSDKFERLE